MSKLPKFHDPNLLVGFDTSDDACVYKVSDDVAVIQTVDFFPPIVDDPYMFGQIAAANSLSDVYAMGGTPSLAMNLLCFPSCLSLDIVQEILRGGYEKVREAGAVIAGGHTIEDPEPKYGLCVSGFINPQDVLANSTVKEGDVLVLTKPLGTGIMTTAAKADLLSDAEVDEMVHVMATLNKYARDIMVKFSPNACTDVTGFGLLGHVYEMASSSGVTIELLSGEVPIIQKSFELAEMGIIPQGAYRNVDYVGDNVRVSSDVSQPIQDIMADPQTSGGLLISVPGHVADDLMSALEDVTPWARIVGHVLHRDDVFVKIK